MMLQPVASKFRTEKSYPANLTPVKNKHRDYRENILYYHLEVKGISFLLTAHDLQDAHRRACRQLEDTRTRNLFQRLFIDWWKNTDDE